MKPGLTLAAYLLLAAASAAQSHPIDAARSTITVRVFRSGFLAIAGDNHEISAPVLRGSVDETQPAVELVIDATAMKVLDPDASAETRAKVQERMLGAEVLDTQHFPRIEFHSTAAQQPGSRKWKVSGELTLHGQARTIDFEVTEEAGRYRGEARLKQSDFGIQPISIAGGAVKVKDEVEIEFDVVLQ